MTELPILRRVGEQRRMAAVLLQNPQHSDVQLQRGESKLVE